MTRELPRPEEYYRMRAAVKLRQRAGQVKKLSVVVLYSWIPLLVLGGILVLQIDLFVVRPYLYVMTPVLPSAASSFSEALLGYAENLSDAGSRLESQHRHQMSRARE